MRVFVLADSFIPITLLPNHPPHSSFFPLIPLWPPAECLVGGSQTYTHKNTHKAKNIVSPRPAADLSCTAQGPDKDGVTGEEDKKVEEEQGGGGWGDGRTEADSCPLSSHHLPVCVLHCLWL